MPRSRACGRTIWRALAAPGRLWAAEPPSDDRALRHVGHSPMLPASASVRHGTPDAPPRAPQEAISRHRPSSRLAPSLLDLVGQTPLVELPRLAAATGLP